MPVETELDKVLVKHSTIRLFNFITILTLF